MNQEYELFKELCLKQKIELSDDNQEFIEKLTEKALNFSCDIDHCYMNEKVVPLSEHQIRKALPESVNESINPLNIVYESVSTNQEIKDSEPLGAYTVLLAEYQTNGQGRRSKQWISPLASNIYLSIKFNRINCPNTQFIPLITALSVCNGLAANGTGPSPFS